MDLDLSGASTKVFAHRFAHFLRTIDQLDERCAYRTGAAPFGIVGVMKFGRARIDMTTGLAKRIAGVEQARTFDEAKLDATSETDIAAAGIANGGKAA